MRLLCPIIFILLRTLDRVRNQFPVSDTVTSRFISHDFPGLAAMASQYPFEEPICSSPVTFFLQIHVNHFTVLICRSPQVMLLAVDLNENVIDVERVAVASVFSFQSTEVYETKLDTPKTNRFSADSDSSFGK